MFPKGLGGKICYVEPGEVISLDEGASWILVTCVYEPPEDSEQVTILTFADGTQTKYDSYRHILYPNYPRELVAAARARISRKWEGI